MIGIRGRVTPSSTGRSPHRSTTSSATIPRPCACSGSSGRRSSTAPRSTCAGACSLGHGCYAERSTSGWAGARRLSANTAWWCRSGGRPTRRCGPSWSRRSTGSAGWQRSWPASPPTAPSCRQATGREGSAPRRPRGGVGPERTGLLSFQGGSSAVVAGAFGRPEESPSSIG